MDDAERDHEVIQISSHGRWAAVLMSEDDLESLRETLFWLSQPGIGEGVIAGQREADEGLTLTADEVRARFGLSNP